MLETIREYGLEQLTASGEADTTRQSHLDFFQKLAQEVVRTTFGAPRRHLLEKAKPEQDNFQAALHWCRQSGDAQAGLQLAVALASFMRLGLFSGGRDWLESALAQTRALGHQAAPERARALSIAGGICWFEGDYAGARPLLEESIGLFRQLGDKPGLAAATLQLANNEREHGELATARALYEEAIVLAREVQDHWMLAIARLSLGRTLVTAGDLMDARALLEESQAALLKIGDPFGLALVRANLGFLTLQQDDYAPALALYKESTALFHEIEERSFILRNLEEMAWLACAQTDDGRAARLFGSAEALRESIGSPLPVAARVEHDRFAGGLLDRLGEAAFAAAWAEGRAMTLEQAVAYALQESTKGEPLV
jgi:non-specific serine/threonine protein kinase